MSCEQKNMQEILDTAKKIANKLETCAQTAQKNRNKMGEEFTKVESLIKKLVYEFDIALFSLESLDIEEALKLFKSIDQKLEFSKILKQKEYTEMNQIKTRIHAASEKMSA